MYAVVTVIVYMAGLALSPKYTPVLPGRAQPLSNVSLPWKLFFKYKNIPKEVRYCIRACMSNFMTLYVKENGQ